MLFRLFILGFVINQFGIASTTSNTQDQNADSPALIYCPEPNQLVKKGLKWESTTNVVWKSYETSFADDVSKFVGAQWQGVKVGQMTCIYKSQNEGVFPITLQNNHLFVQPTQTNWQFGQDGFMNCVSENTKDCPLTPKVKEETPTDTREVFQGLNIQR